MGEAVEKDTAGPAMSESEFFRVQTLIKELAGIHLDPSKRCMVETRLLKRLNEVNCPTFAKYAKHVVQSPEETQFFIDALTTNLTSFFREDGHFHHFENLCKDSYAGRRMNVWCGACSTGEEAYTIALVCEQAAQFLGDFDYRILATDIDRRVLTHAERGVYKKKDVESIPHHVMMGNFMVNRATAEYKVSPHISRKIKFRFHNLVDSDQIIPMKFDVVFLRNVLIYFQEAVVDQVAAKISQNLKPGGILYVGHSETIDGAKANLRRIGSSIYERLP